MNLPLILGQTKTAMNIVKYIMDSQDILDKSEQKLKLAELMESLANIKVETSEIKSVILEKDKKILELEKKLNLKKNLVFERPYYWIYKDSNREGPFCPKCYDSNEKFIRLHGYNEQYSCLECKSDFMTQHQMEVESKQALEAIKRFNVYNNR